LADNKSDAWLAVTEGGWTITVRRDIGVSLVLPYFNSGARPSKLSIERCDPHAKEEDHPGSLSLLMHNQESHQQ
jgi:hypothetical protein